MVHKVGGGGVKKDKLRYTIRFCSADPKHQKTMDVLDALGRRKASFIADAVCEHLARHGPDYADIMSKHTSYVPAYHNNPSPNQTYSDTNNEVVTCNGDDSAPHNETYLPHSPDNADVDESNPNHFDDDTRQAILDGLNMFND